MARHSVRTRDLQAVERLLNAPGDVHGEIRDAVRTLVGFARPEVNIETEEV